MPISAPTRKMLRPTISRSPPMMKRGTCPGSRGAMVKFRISTMIMIGTTETADSLNFETKFEVIIFTVP